MGKGVDRYICVTLYMEKIGNCLTPSGQHPSPSNQPTNAPQVRLADADLTKGMEKTYRALLKTHAEALAAVEAEGHGSEALPASPPASPAKGPEPSAVAVLGAEGDAEAGAAGAAGADAGAKADAESGAAAEADASVSARMRQGLVSVNKAKLAHLRVQEEAMRSYLGSVVDSADMCVWDFVVWGV